MKYPIYRKHNGQDTGTEPVQPAHNPIRCLFRLGLLTLGITTTVVAQDTIFLNQTNFVYFLNNSNPGLNSDFRLVENITLPPSWSWTPIGTSDNPATLRFNGSYHAISGLNVTTVENNTPTGLFGYLVDSWVHGVILDRIFVRSEGDASEAGAIAGRILRTNITENLVTGGTVETRGDINSPERNDHHSCAGGITGSASSSRIENNLNNAAVNTTGRFCYAGGIIGCQEYSTASGNVNTGNVSTKELSKNNFPVSLLLSPSFPRRWESTTNSGSPPTRG